MVFRATERNGASQLNAEIECQRKLVPQNVHPIKESRCFPGQGPQVYSRLLILQILVSGKTGWDSNAVRDAQLFSGDLATK